MLKVKINEDELIGYIYRTTDIHRELNPDELLDVFQQFINYLKANGYEVRRIKKNDVLNNYFCANCVWELKTTEKLLDGISCPVCKKHTVLLKQEE